MTLQEYFQANENYFWQWEEEIELITVPGGSTIAYRGYIMELLEPMALQGLPPFGALLLAIMATNNAVGDLFEELNNVFSELSGQYEKELYTEAEEFMRLLQAMPAQYKTGERRKLLFQTLFQQSHRGVSVHDSKYIIETANKLYKGHRGNLYEQLMRKTQKADAAFIKDFRCLALLKKKFPDAATIMQRMADMPNLENVLPEIIHEKEGGPAEKKDFIEELMENPQSFQVGSLIKSLWAGLNIPFHNVLPSEQPLGGISDITNKGDFDKLLISEFANDDLVFLSRLANNEALYLQREVPPVSNKIERIFLVDVTLRSWGTPKILAYAVMLAIAKHPKTDIHCTAFALGNHYHPVFFDTVHEVIDGLQQLDAGLHAAKGMELFFKEFKHAKKLEVFYLSSPEALKEEAMQRVMKENQKSFKYWITLAANGEIELYRNQQNSRKFIQQIKLPLEELWKQPPPVNKRKNEKRLMVIPEQEYPILFPIPQMPKAVMVTSENEVYVVSRHRKLFRLYEKEEKLDNRGAELILEDLPKGATRYAIGLNTRGMTLLLCFISADRQVIIYNLNTRQQVSGHFNGWHGGPYDQFFFCYNSFHYMNPANYWIIEGNNEVTHTRIRRLNNDFESEYRDNETAMSNAVRRINPRYSILTNIREAGICNEGYLQFGKHRLALLGQKYIQLATLPVYKRELKVAAVWDNGSLLFPNGSRVLVNQSGMIVLRPADRGDSLVYIPAAIEFFLGLATDDCFAGHEYFYPSLSTHKKEQIDSAEFYSRYISTFINEILNYAT